MSIHRLSPAHLGGFDTHYECFLRHHQHNPNDAYVPDTSCLWYQQPKARALLKQIAKGPNSGFLFLVGDKAHLRVRALYEGIKQLTTKTRIVSNPTQLFGVVGQISGALYQEGICLLDATSLSTDDCALLIQAQHSPLAIRFVEGNRLIQEVNETARALVVLHGDETVFDALSMHLPLVRYEWADTAQDSHENARVWLMAQADVDAIGADCLLWLLYRRAGSQRHFALDYDFLGQILAHLDGRDCQSILRAHRAYQRQHGTLRQLFFDDIASGKTHLYTKGEKVGQVNALSVIEDALPFGIPTRLVASLAGAGDEMQDLESESELAGPIHTKGMLQTLAVARALMGKVPLNVQVNLWFEQSYSTQDGDSASLASLLCILSVLSGFGICQHLAVTGALDVEGNVLAVGAVTEKVEGFYAFAKTQNAKCGVVIPRACVDELILCADVVKAVSEDRFEIYAIDTYEDALTLLFGKNWGEILDAISTHMQEYKDDD